LEATGRMFLVFVFWKSSLARVRCCSAWHHLPLFEIARDQCDNFRHIFGEKLVLYTLCT
jgi:hypothetical protein